MESKKTKEKEEETVELLRDISFWLKLIFAVLVSIFVFLVQSKIFP